jgi:anti-sigma factor RsiW
MTERELLTVSAHPAAALLPAFLNGTLSEDDRRQVSEHLQSCAQCRRELDECVRLREGLRQVYAAQPGPSPVVLRAVVEQVKREKARTWIGRLDERLRSFLGAPWAPTFALALVLTQLGLLVWTSQYGERAASEVATRSVPAQTVQLRVTFQAAATHGEMQSVLKEIRGRIVDGPTAAGLYTVEVPLGDDATVARYLKLLRARTEVVRSAEPVPQ